MQISSPNTVIMFPEKSSYLFLQGEAGKIELLLTPKNLINSLHNTIDTVAIICHPHPLHSGTMDNKVVYTLHKTLHSLGCTTIRFNFRGVGRSEGNFDNSIGEYNDLMTIIEWIYEKKPNSKIILAGFSFGAFIALKASKKINCIQLISVAPAIHHQDYTKYMPINCPWLLIQGTQDEIVPSKLVYDWIASLTIKPYVIKFPNAGHFFHGELTELKEKITSYFETSKILNS